jgi:peptidoglycan/xylan/chitin deacetylase (PgdA/CDA1 family)
VVLSYHAIADHRGDQLLRRYSVPPARFAAQLDALRSAGWTFVDADTLLDALAGRRRLPARALLLTFDDGYADFATVALPELAPRGIPAVVFVVTSMVGRTNEWDSRIGATPVALMDAQALRAVAAAGVEIGSHGLVHEPMTPLDADTVEAHARESAEALEGLGLPRPRLFAYPYGQLPEAAAGASEALRRAGYSAAFTVEPGVACAAQDLFALPRLMVLRGFRPPILRLRIATLRWRRGRLVERAFEFVGMRG